MGGGGGIVVLVWPGVQFLFLKNLWYKYFLFRFIRRGGRGRGSGPPRFPDSPLDPPAHESFTFHIKYGRMNIKKQLFLWPRSFGLKYILHYFIIKNIGWKYTIVWPDGRESMSLWMKIDSTFGSVTYEYNYPLLTFILNYMKIKYHAREYIIFSIVMRYRYNYSNLPYVSKCPLSYSAIIAWMTPLDYKERILWNASTVLCR